MNTISVESRDHLRQTIIDEIKSSEESIRALRSRRNELAPISRLPPETLATIFTFLSASTWDEKPVHFRWIWVTHVCRRWREAALNYPRFWSYINFTKLTSAGMAEIFARAKMAPLHLEADAKSGRWMNSQIKAFEGLLEAHISHTRYLSISGLGSALARLSSSAPILESLSFSYAYYGLSIPDNFLNCTAPNLTSLELENCDVSWKSPLFKGLRNLQILNISTKARPELEDWLDALNEMPKLKSLSVRSATPVAPLASPLISEPSRIITLPSLTHFHIRAVATDCALALAHLLLPALIRLHVDVISQDKEGEDVFPLIPFVARNVYVLQDIESIRSILIAGERTCAEVYAWVIPDADVKIHDPATLRDTSRSSCLMFAAKGDKWRNGVDTAIFDALLTLLPMNSVLTLTAQNRTRPSKEFWLRHASKFPLLEQARLVPTSIGAFLEMLAGDTPRDGPRFPSLTRFILLHVTLTTVRTHHLGDVFMKRMEQGIPVEVLDLSTCVGTDRASQFLAKTVVDLKEPLDAPPMAMKDFFNLKHVGERYGDEVEYDDGREPWYYVDVDDGEGEDEDEDGDEMGLDEFDYDEELQYALFDGDDFGDNFI